MSKKKILLVTDWYYPGYKAGGPIQSCRNLVALLKEDIEWHVLTSDRDLGEMCPYEGIISDQWQQGSVGENIYYANTNGITVKSIMTLLKNIQPDILYINSMFSLKYTIYPLIALSRMRMLKKVVLAPRGMLHQGALFFKEKKKLLFLRCFRLFYFHKFIRFHATDRQEINDIKKQFGQTFFYLAENIPNINIEFGNTKGKVSGVLNLIFFSRIHQKKNLYYIIDLLVNREFTGKISLDIYGDAESDTYLKLCMDLAKRHPPNVSINFLGGKPNKEILQRLPDYDVFVLPTMGENFGHAIFEALMSGIPVLVSNNSPWINLQDSLAGWDIPLENHLDYVLAIQKLLDMDNDTHMLWRKGARKKAENYIDQSNFRSKYLELFNEDRFKQI